jgi:actin-like ATPase involved in cell morphogenesis
VHRTGFRLGIDFGTSHTVAVLHWPDGRAKVLLFDGSPLLPSAVYAEPDGRLVVGRDAVNSSRIDPGRYEPNPKRRIDEGTVLLGQYEIPVEELIASVLRLVADEARRTSGDPLAAITLTCPAAWGPRRRRTLVSAAARAGFPDTRVIEEPVAAATYFAQVLGHRMAVGSAVVVYDFGGGTFDVSVLERMVYGFRTLAVDGRDDIGGLDLDEALIDFLVREHAHHDPAAWQRLAEPRTSEERRQRRLFRDDVRSAKERLSRHPTAELYVPGFDRNVHVTREEFEAVVRPLLDETVRMTGALVRRTGVPADRIAGVFLVGGSSRLPLVSTLVHRTLLNAPTVIEQPELVVAEGSVLVRGVGAAVQLPGPAGTSPAGPVGPWPGPSAPQPTSDPTPATPHSPVWQPVGPQQMGELPPGRSAVPTAPADYLADRAPSAFGQPPAPAQPSPGAAHSPTVTPPGSTQGSAYGSTHGSAQGRAAAPQQATAGTATPAAPTSAPPATRRPTDTARPLSPATQVSHDAPPQAADPITLPRPTTPGHAPQAPAPARPPTQQPHEPSRPEHSHAEHGAAAPSRPEYDTPEHDTPAPGRPTRADRRVRRAAVLAIALAAVIALTLSVTSFTGKDSGDRGKGGAAPTTDGALASTGPPDPCWSGATRQQAPTGAAAPPPAFALDARWRWHEDPTGFRIPVLKEWTQATAPAGVCFAEPHGAGFLGVRVSPAGDDLKAHVERVESRAEALPGYRRVAVLERPASAFPAGLEFTFTLGSDLMHAEIHTQLSGPRIYDVYWCTWDNDWLNSRQDFSVVIGGFRPAQ